ncbi:MAG: hypothetical protein GY938_24530 [Ketobacter sp.]|nr:hypothetical protein [Ketobacter sp.]
MIDNLSEEISKLLLSVDIEIDPNKQVIFVDRESFYQIARFDPNVMRDVVSGDWYWYKTQIKVNSFYKSLGEVSYTNEAPDTPSAEFVERPFYLSIHCIKENGRLVYYDHPDCDEAYL